MGQSKSLRKSLQQVTLLLAIFPVIFLPVVLFLLIHPVIYFPVVLLLAIPLLMVLPFLHDHFLPPPGWLEPPDPSLQIFASLASTISESLSDVVVPATL